MGGTKGFNVIYPMGYDSFGLPAENAAIQHGIDPEKWTNDNITQIKSQQKQIGLSYDWRREIYSHDENYYRWNQWFFLSIVSNPEEPLFELLLGNEAVTSPTSFINYLFIRKNSCT